MNDVCQMYEMNTNNMLVDVEIFSLCREETLFQAEFQQYKWNSGPLFSQRNLDRHSLEGFCPGGGVRSVEFVLEPFDKPLSSLLSDLKKKVSR